MSRCDELAIDNATACAQQRARWTSSLLSQHVPCIAPRLCNHDVRHAHRERQLHAPRGEAWRGLRACVAISARRNVRRRSSRRDARGDSAFWQRAGPIARRPRARRSSTEVGRHAIAALSHSARLDGWICRDTLLIASPRCRLIACVITWPRHRTPAHTYLRAAPRAAPCSACASNRAPARAWALAPTSAIAIGGRIRTAHAAREQHARQARTNAAACDPLAERWRAIANQPWM